MRLSSTKLVGIVVFACAIVACVWLLLRQAALPGASESTRAVSPATADIRAVVASSSPASRAHVGASSVTSRVAPAPAKTSFGGERDLWAFAHAAASRGNAADTYEAWQATFFCQSLGEGTSEFDNFAAGKPSHVQGKVTPERMQAINEMKLRCNGFEQAGKSKTAQFAREQKAILAGTPFAALSTASVTSSQVRALLASESPDAVAAASYLALKPWLGKLQVPDDDPRAEDVALAVTISHCDLGYECSVNGTQSLEQCAYAGICGRDVRDVVATIFDQERVARINSYRQQFIEAIKNRNWAALGLTGE